MYIVTVGMRKEKKIVPFGGGQGEEEGGCSELVIKQECSKKVS